MKAPHQKATGFTLIELVITVTLLGVLLAISVPGFRQLTLNQGIKSAAFDLLAALEYTRSEAIKRPGETITLQPVSGGSWSTGWRLLDGGGDVLRNWTVASNITVVDKNTTPLTQVVFTKDGHATATPKLEVSTTSTVAGVSARCVKVDLIGRPTAQMTGCS